MTVGRLSAYLSRAATQPWEWGRTDCMMFLADWVRDRTGQDPAHIWRCAYATEEGAALVMARYGGLVPMIDTLVTPLGLARTEDPQLGAIGVVRIFNIGKVVDLAGGILCDARGHWVVRWRSPSGGHGLIRGKASVVAAWSF